MKKLKTSVDAMINQQSQEKAVAASDQQIETKSSSDVKMENTAKTKNIGAASRHSMDQKTKTVVNQNTEQADTVSKQKAERLDSQRQEKAEKPVIRHRYFQRGPNDAEAEQYREKST